jgi:hypothetical protein
MVSPKPPTAARPISEWRLISERAIDAVVDEVRSADPDADPSVLFCRTVRLLRRKLLDEVDPQQAAALVRELTS